MANTAFGKLVGVRPEGDSKPKSRRRSGGGAPACVTTLAIQLTNGKRASDSQAVCRLTVSPVGQGTSMQATPSSCLFCRALTAWEDYSSFETRPLMN